MSITYNWSVSKLQTRPQIENLNDVVVYAEWKLTASENGVEVERIGIESFDLSTEGFVPFNQLTEQQVLSWINKNVNKELAESMLAEVLEKNLNPPIIEKALPWVKA
jgi:hypothetical protein